MRRRRPGRGGDSTGIDAEPNPRARSDVSTPVILVPSAEPTSPTSTDEPTTRDDAFDALFRAHYDRLVRTLTVVAGDRESAADAVQEAFVRAHVRWRRVGRYDDPVGWVRRVAINRLRDDHRRAGRRQRALSRLAARTNDVADATEPDDVERLLRTLPRQQRLSTAFFYVDGLSVAEIADALGIAEGSVKSHLHDARKRLRSVLEAEHRAEPGSEGGAST